MKQILNVIALFSLMVFAVSSCKKDENKIYFEGGTAPVISASKSNVVLLADNAAKTAVTFSWTNPEYQFTTGVSSQNVTYSLEIDSAGANFSSGVKRIYSIVNDISRSFTVSELNTILVSGMGLSVNEPHAIEARVVSSLSKSAPTELVSNVISVTVTPYDQPVIITYLYVPGNYQGWSPSTAAQLGSVDTKNYEGYVYFSEDNTKFKFTSQPDWNGTNYGEDGAGAISPTGPDITMPATTGYYLVKVDLSTLKWTYQLMNWSMIGAATPGGWDNDTPMMYNADDKTLVIESVALSAGEFKFRANSGWDVNLGSNPEGGNYLAYNGGNLSVPETGNYKVVLDLSHPYQFTYTLSKL